MIADIAAYLARKDVWLWCAIVDQWMRGGVTAHSRMWVVHGIDTEDEPILGGGVLRRMTSGISDIARPMALPRTS